MVAVVKEHLLLVHVLDEVLLRLELPGQLLGMHHGEAPFLGAFDL